MTINSEEQISTCNVCKKEFSGIKPLMQHLRNHIKIETNEPPIKIIPPEEVQISNVNSSSGEKQISSKWHCELCDKPLATERILKEHIVAVHENKRLYPCKYCNKSFKRREDRFNHKKVQHEEHTHQCVKCPRKFGLKYFLKSHLARAHKIGNFLCVTCGKAFVNSKMLSLHNCNLQEGTYECKCDLCGESFASKKALKIHAGHAHKTEHKCSDCGEKFSKTLLLKTHRMEIHGKSNVFNCNICDHSFRTSIGISKHNRKSHEFSCKCCGKKFVRKYHLKIHEKIHKVEKKEVALQKVKCTRCSKILANRFSLRIHLLRIHNDHKVAKFSCEICDKKFTTKTFMLSHLKIKHQGYMQKCEFCDKDFTSRSLMLNHVRYVHEGLREKCQSCDKSFGTKSSLQLHIKTVHEKIRASKCVECKFCEGTLTSRSNLKTHMLEQHGDETFARVSCYYCDKKFVYKSLLSYHMRREHEQVKDYKCDFCHVTMSAKFNLKRHMLEQHNDERFANVLCHLCDKKFICKSHQRNHVRMVHEETKDFRCEFCQTTMASKFSFQKHMLVQHNDERFANVPCKSCNKKFICESLMRYHVRRVHEQAKDYKCDRCGKEYGQKGQRDRHFQRVHQGIREFSCDICEKRFSIKQDLQLHKENHHEPWSYYKCSFCEKETSNSKHMRLHLKRFHDEMHDSTKSLQKLCKDFDKSTVK